MTRDGTVGRSDATERNLPVHRDIDPARVMRPRFADSIRASSPSGLREQAGHMTRSASRPFEQVFAPAGVPQLRALVGSHDPRRSHFPLGNEPQVVAVHEAGHAVTGVVLGQPVELVRPRLTTYRVPLWTMRGRYRAAIVTLAGPAAEDRFCLYAYRSLKPG